MNPASSSVRAIVIGADRSEQLSMLVTRREFPEASDYWDGNWVYATIRIRAGAFRGEYEALLRTNELASFRDQLGTLHAATGPNCPRCSQRSTKSFERSPSRPARDSSKTPKPRGANLEASLLRLKDSNLGPGG